MIIIKNKIKNLKNNNQRVKFFMLNYYFSLVIPLRFQTLKK